MRSGLGLRGGYGAKYNHCLEFLDEGMIGKPADVPSNVNSHKAYYRQNKKVEAEACYVT
jgi:hypothetical protein